MADRPPGEVQRSLPSHPTVQDHPSKTTAQSHPSREGRQAGNHPPGQPIQITDHPPENHPNGRLRVKIGGKAVEIPLTEDGFYKKEHCKEHIFNYSDQSFDRNFKCEFVGKECMEGVLSKWIQKFDRHNSFQVVKGPEDPIILRFITQCPLKSLGKTALQAPSAFIYYVRNDNDFQGLVGDGSGCSFIPMLVRLSFHQLTQVSSSCLQHMDPSTSFKEMDYGSFNKLNNEAMYGFNQAHAASFDFARAVVLYHPELCAKFPDLSTLLPHQRGLISASCLRNMHHGRSFSKLDSAADVMSLPTDTLRSIDEVQCASITDHTWQELMSDGTICQIIPLRIVSQKRLASISQICLLRGLNYGLFDGFDTDNVKHLDKLVFKGLMLEEVAKFPKDIIHSLSDSQFDELLKTNAEVCVILVKDSHLDPTRKSKIQSSCSYQVKEEASAKLVHIKLSSAHRTAVTAWLTAVSLAIVSRVFLLSF